MGKRRQNTTPATPGGSRRVFGYVRVSGQEQGRHGTSLEGQGDELRRYCAAHRLPEPAIFSEVESASAERNERRLELQRVLSDAREGDVVLVAALDRWSRDIVFGVQSVRDLVRRGVGFIAIRESLDARTPAGDSTLGLMAWVAEQERLRIRVRTVGRRKELRDQGAYVEGLPPFGYRRGERPARRLVVQRDEAAVVREMFGRAISGESIPTIGAWMQGARHGAPRKWDRSDVHRVLHSRTYLGEVQGTRGRVVAHEAIIDPATFERAQEALRSRRLGGRTPSTPRTSTWLLRGIANCPRCGARMGAAHSAHAREYYACARRLAHRDCALQYARVSVVDDVVATLAEARLVELREELAREERKPAAPVSTSDPALKLTRIEARRVRVLDMAEEGLLDRAELRRRLDRLDGERRSVEAAAARTRQQQEATTPAATRAALATISTLKKAWAHAEPGEKREIIQRLAERITIDPAREPVVDVAWRTVQQLREDAVAATVALGRMAPV